jgi:hypothetical protein
LSTHVHQADGGSTRNHEGAVVCEKPPPPYKTLRETLIQRKEYNMMFSTSY